MQCIDLYLLSGEAIIPHETSIVTTSLFPHIAVVDVTLTFPKVTASVLVIKGRIGFPSLRILNGSSPIVDYEVITNDPRILISVPHEMTTITLQWNTSFVPITDTQSVLSLPTVPTCANIQNYSVALNWGAQVVGSTISDRNGTQIVPRKSGGLSEKFTYDSKNRGSLAIFATTVTTTSLGNSVFSSKSILASLIKSGGVGVISVILAIIATFIFGQWRSK